MRLSATKLSAINYSSGFGDSLYNAAGQIPSLDLQLATTKSLTDAVTGASLVTFTRASSGTFVGSDGLIQTAATDVPRFDHNPITGESLGLLVEEQRVNLLLQSNGFDTTWTNSNSSETAASGTAPNGTNTAWELKDTVDASTTTHVIQQASISFTTGASYTFTVWAKQGTLPGIALLFPGTAFSTTTATRFNVTLGTVAAAGANTTNSITAFSNGWFRCAMTMTATATATGTVSIRTATDSTTSYQGDGTGTILIWGAQLEAGAFPTSYIPTTAAAATRSADVCSITNANLLPWFTSFDEHTFYAELKGEPPKATGSSIIIMEGLVSGTIGGISLNINTTATRFRSQQRHGVARFDSGNANGGTLNNTINRVALRASALGSQSAENGLLPTSAGIAQADWNTGASIAIGKRSTGSLLFLNGCIARIAYWPQSLANSTLQSLTQ